MLDIESERFQSSARIPCTDGEEADGRHASDHARSPIYRAAAPRCLSKKALISPKAALPMCAVLPGGLLLLCQAQDSGQHTWFHGNRTDAGVALLCKIAQNTSRGHHEKEIAAQFFEYSRRIVPVDALRNVICQITRHQFLHAHSSRVHISDIRHLRCLKSHCGNPPCQDVGDGLE